MTIPLYHVRYNNLIDENVRFSIEIVLRIGQLLGFKGKQRLDRIQLDFVHLLRYRLSYVLDGKL
jgi:hypothetical protein